MPRRRKVETSKKNQQPHMVLELKPPPPPPPPLSSATRNIPTSVDEEAGGLNLHPKCLSNPSVIMITICTCLLVRPTSCSPRQTPAVPLPPCPMQHTPRHRAIWLGLPKKKNTITHPSTQAGARPSRGEEEGGGQQKKTTLCKTNRHRKGDHKSPADLAGHAKIRRSTYHSK